MSDTVIQNILSLLGLLIVPWVVWVTASLFNQRQELALIRQILDNLVRKTH